MTYMMTHPGKKLTFMGCELGAFREWDHEREQEWFLTEYEMHGKMQLFTACLNRFYLSNPALWQGDGDSKSFAWLDADDALKIRNRRRQASVTALLHHRKSL